MSLNQFFKSLEATSVGTAVRESLWLFPTIESLHVLACVLVVGTIVIVDLRLLNLASRGRSVSELTAEVLPLTWIAFGCAVISGGLLFTSSALKYSQNQPFVIKMLLLALAGINMAVFHLGAFRQVASWDRVQPPIGAKVAAALSLVIWVSVIGFGRWIGFTT